MAFSDPLKEGNVEENKQNENENRIPRENGKPGNRKNTKGLKKLKEVREKLRIKAEYRDPVRPEADFEEPFEDDQKPGNETVAATDKKIYLRVLVNLALTLIALALIIWLLPAALRFFMPFVVAIIISMIANPFVKFLKKRLKFARKVSSAIVIVLVVVAVAAALYGIGYFLVYETFKLYDNRVEILQTIENALSDAGERLTGFYNILPAKMQAFVSGTIEDLSEGATKFIDNIKLPSVSGVGGAVGGTLTGLVAPLVFRTVAEYPIALVLAAGFCAAGMFARVRRPVAWAYAALAVACVVGLGVRLCLEDTKGRTYLYRDRGFFGTVAVTSVPAQSNGVKGELHEYIHGTTVHGIQVCIPGKERMPTAYHTANGGGLAITQHPKYKAGLPMRVCIVGMGVWGCCDR